MTKTSDKIDLQEIVTPLEYLARDSLEGYSYVIINAVFKNSELSPKTYNGIFAYLNNVFLKQNIHMAFDRVRSDLSYDHMMDSMSKFAPGRSLVFRFNFPKSDIGPKDDVMIVPIDYKLSRLEFHGTIKGDIEDIKERLDKIGYRIGN